MRCEFQSVDLNWEFLGDQSLFVTFLTFENACFMKDVVELGGIFLILLFGYTRSYCTFVNSEEVPIALVSFHFSRSGRSRNREGVKDFRDRDCRSCFNGIV